MEQHWYDGKSITGTITSFIFAFIGTLTLNEWASVAAICAGFTTMIYTIIKIINESKKQK